MQTIAGPGLPIFWGIHLSRKAVFFVSIVVFSSINLENEHASRRKGGIVPFLLSIFQEQHFSFGISSFDGINIRIVVRCPCRIGTALGNFNWLFQKAQFEFGPGTQ